MPIDGIERADWGSGGENRSVATTGTSDAITPPSQIIREMEAWPNTPDPTSNGEVVASSNSSQASPATFGPELERELSRLPDGYDASLEYFRNDLDALLTAEVRDRNAFIRYFDTLSPIVQDKALVTALKNPGLSMLALRDKVKARLTLDEAAEAERWWSRLKVLPRDARGSRSMSFDYEKHPLRNLIGCFLNSP